MIGKYIADSICNKVSNKRNYLGVDWTFVDAANQVKQKPQAITMQTKIKSSNGERRRKSKL